MFYRTFAVESLFCSNFGETMRLSFTILTVVVACIFLSGCGESNASRQAEAALRSAEERATAAEKALADQNASKKLAADKASATHAETSQGNVAPISQPAAISNAPEQVAPKDAKLAEFQTGMSKFIDEAKSFARSMELLPERDAYKNRIAQLEESYSRIPDPPLGNEALAMCRKAARQITVDFKVGDLYLKFIDDFLRLDSKDGADKSAEQFRDLGTKQKALLDELDSATTEGRIPKIELSDVIKGNN